MIISASRRTDIPAYYSAWFLNRVRAGYVHVRNPMNFHQISKISLTPDVVDGMVFWTKNPLPMLDKLPFFHEYMYYFQFTLTSYGTDVESHVPNKNKVIIPAFQRLSELIGPERVIWRYDPIFLTETYTLAYHIRYFEKLARRLAPYTKRCTISFLDSYKKIEKNMASLGQIVLTPEQQIQLAKDLAEIARDCGLQVDACAEGSALRQLGIAHARCVDNRLLEHLLGCPLDMKKDKNQRAECGCAESVDIGAYNTCSHGCRYCYANYSERSVTANRGKHIPESPLLIGEAGEGDTITERKMLSCKVNQFQFHL